MGRFWIFFAYNGVPKSEILFPLKGMGNFIAEKSGNGDWTHNKKNTLGLFRTAKWKISNYSGLCSVCLNILYDYLSTNTD